MCRWADVDSEVSAEAVQRLYTAPEVNGIFQLTPAADWWSFGALTFELLTGKVGKCDSTQIQIYITISDEVNVLVSSFAV
jgi:serine/threonine protein kinase